MMVLNELTHLLVHLPSDIPTPGNPEAPPGFEKFQDIMNWAKWICLGVLVLLLMAAGVRVAMPDTGRGDGSEHAGRVGKVFIGVLVVSAAGSLVGFLVT